jgi:HEAT repeat protein
MIKTLVCSVCLWFLSGSGAAAQNKVTKLRGTVQDATTKNPVAGATVSASGDTAQQSEITDDRGFFRILIEGVSPGDLVRIRVEKVGYAVYDQQVVASEEIPLNIFLRRTAAATAPPARRAIEPAAPANPVDARFIQEMKDQNPMVRLNALKVLVDGAPTDSAAMVAVIAAALDVDYRVRVKAIAAIEQLRPVSKDAVTNLLVDLHDLEPLVQAQSIDALGSFPKDKDAQAALFRLLGSPPSINDRVMSSLIRSGVEDPRLSEAIIYAVQHGNKDAFNALSKKVPFSRELISRLLVELGKSLDSTRNFQAQEIIKVLLKGDGEPGRQALHQFLAAADSYRQSRLVLCWLEVEHDAKAELLEIVRVADITAELRKALASTQTETVFLPYGEFPFNKAADCSRGVMLRAAMGMLVLDLEPRKDAWDALAFGLNTAPNAEWQCGIYSATVPGWLSPSRAKPIVPLLVKDLLCYPVNNRPTQQRSTRVGANADLIVSLKNALAKIGDEDTIVLIQQSAAEGMVICGNNANDDPDGKKGLAELIGRIRSRTNN